MQRQATPRHSASIQQLYGPSQPPARQLVLQSPLHSNEQPPPLQEKSHSALFPQVIVHPPPLQLAVQFELTPHETSQSPSLQLRSQSRLL